jgi:hypothetical protein
MHIKPHFNGLNQRVLPFGQGRMNLSSPYSVFEAAAGIHLDFGMFLVFSFFNLISAADRNKLGSGTPLTWEAQMPPDRSGKSDGGDHGENVKSHKPSKAPNCHQFSDPPPTPSYLLGPLQALSNPQRRKEGVYHAAKGCPAFPRFEG